MSKRYTVDEVRKYVEPLLSEASSDSWHGEYNYVYGWKGNPIVAAILQLKKESEEKSKRIKELERDLYHYKTRYEEAAINARKLIGATP